MAEATEVRDDHIEDVRRDMRRHGMSEEAVEEAVAEARAQRTGRPTGPRLPADVLARRVRHRRRPRLWRTLTSFPGEASLLVLVLAGVQSSYQGDWWALPALFALLVLQSWGMEEVFRRWADGLFDPATGAPTSTAAGVRLVLGGLGHVGLVALVAGQILW